MLKIFVHVLVAAALIGVGLAAGIWKFQRDAERQSAEERLERQLSEQAATMDRVAAELEDLRAELAALAASRKGEASAELRSELETLRSRVAKAETAAFRPKVVPATVPSPLPASYIERDATSPAWRVSERTWRRDEASAVLARIRLREKWLDEFPEDRESPRILEDLIGEYLKLNKISDARRILALYGRTLPQWGYDRLAAAISYTDGDYVGARRLLLAVRDGAEFPEWARADAMLQYANTYLQEGNRDEAKAHFEGLIIHYGDSPPPGVNDALKSAREQLAALNTP